MHLTINFHPTTKQHLAWQILQNSTTTELLFGGGAGGAKSYLGCAWLLISCVQYPGSRWLMGRSKLKNLKESTLLTFFEVATAWGFKLRQHYKFDEQDNIITFWNGSQIYLKDLFLYPADRNFDSLGSTEYTGAFVDEANQIVAKARDVVSTRLRYRLDEFGLIPKLLLSCNPAKNWVYADFYKPWREGELSEDRAFVQALVTDNPHISLHYIAKLKRLKDKALKERLLYGNWEYDDDPYALFGIDALTDLFTNTAAPSAEKYLSVDVARYGSDKTVAMAWQGLQVIDIRALDKSGTDETAQLIQDLCQQHQIRLSQVVVDEDGIGGGVIDQLKRACKGFTANATPRVNPIEEKQTFKTNYANLKAQCYYTLAQLVEEGKIGITTADPEIRDAIIAELEQVKAKRPEADSKIRVISKEEIKEVLERSPDFADTLMMRMYFEVDRTPEPRIRSL